MSTFRWEINEVTTGGPYTYIIFQDGVGKKAVTGVQTPGAAMDGIKTDVGGLIASGDHLLKVTGQTFTGT